MVDQRQRSLAERLAPIPAGRHLVPRALVAENQRERTLLAVTELVAERGYQKTTVELIAKTARVALVTFYEHFENKEASFLAAFDESIATAAQVLAGVVDEARPWPEQISLGLDVLLELVEREPARARLCLVDAQAAGRRALARYQAMLEGLAPKLREGRSFNPRASAMPEGLEVAIAGGLAWLLHRRLLDGRAAGVRALLPEMLQVTLTPYLGEVEAGRAADSAKTRVAA